MRPQVAFPERIHIHIGCIGDQEEEEEWTRMGKKGGEWKGYLARVGGGSSSWLVALRLGHWCGTAGVQEGHTAPGEYSFLRHIEEVHMQALFVRSKSIEMAHLLPIQLG